MKTKQDAIKAIETIRQFISKQQLSFIGDACRGEEKQFFFDKLCEYAERIQSMPKTYEQDGKGQKAVAYLHYFSGGSDFWITEKDMDAEQNQAFGLVRLHGEYPEMGYISIQEITGAGVELDLHFTPKPLDELGVLRPEETAKAQKHDELIP